MKELLTTYIVRGKKMGFLWEFQYDLNGFLRGFKILEGQLTGNQMKWLFNGSNFPASELLMQTLWLKNKDISSLIEVEIGEPDLSFETFWNTYNHKIKRKDTLSLWNRLSKAKRIEALKYIKVYDSYLARKHVDKANPHKYLNKEYWLDNHASIH